MMDPERKAVLLSKYLADELSPAEREELDLAALAEPGLRDAMRLLKGLQEIPPRDISTAEERTMLERGLAKWRSTINEQEVLAPTRMKSLPVEQTPVPTLSPEPGRRRWFSWVAAASVLTIVTFGAIRYFTHRDLVQPVLAQTDPIPANKEVVAKYGTRSYLMLPDSSKLWLNAGSKVSYTEGFPGGHRELTLTGEAFFDIRHDPDHPFLVHTGAIDVRVLGTSFNVKAYPGDATIETTLIQGKVELDWKNGDSKPLVLSPSEKVIIPVQNPTAKTQQATGAQKEPAVFRQTIRPDSMYKTIIETSWVEDKLVFRNESFAGVAEKLERWYNIRIHFASEKYQDIRLSGNFKDQSIGNVMDALQISLGFHYRIEGDSIRVW